MIGANLCHNQSDKYIRNGLVYLLRSNSKPL